MPSSKTCKRNIVMFPFMAQGHLIPFLALARSIERKKAFTITIVNTPLNIRKLRSSIELDSDIRLAEIPFCVKDYGLPPDAENTDALSYSDAIRLFEASETLRVPFKTLLTEISTHDGCAPLCIISDMFLGWTVEVAKEFEIFHSVFIAGAGYSMALYFSISLNKSLWKIDEEDFSLPDFPEAGKVHQSRLPSDLKYFDGVSPFFDFRVRQMSLCLRSDAILLNAIEGMGQNGVTYFQRKTGGKPVWTIGPATSVVLKRELSPSYSTSCTYSKWLDQHPPASVLYASFGTQARISSAQMMELAIGLEKSGKPFMWAIRPPSEYDKSEEFRAAWLPDGYEERMKNQNTGLLIHKWAPQQEILSHKSIGAFLSHCGWNSALESMCAGVPILAWPLGGEQFFNSSLLEKEVGVCVEVRDGNKDDIVKCDHIAQVIKMIMGKNMQAENMRKKALETKWKLEEAIIQSEEAMDEFIRTALSK